MSDAIRVLPNACEVLLADVYDLLQAEDRAAALKACRKLQRTADAVKPIVHAAGGHVREEERLAADERDYQQRRARGQQQRAHEEAKKRAAAERPDLDLDGAELV